MGENFTDKPDALSETVEDGIRFDGILDEVAVYNHNGDIVEGSGHDLQMDPIGVVEVPVETTKLVPLSRKRTVMTLDPDQEEAGTGNFVFFNFKDEETASKQEGYYMTTMDWEAFGRPQVVTVGVVPGDILNGP